jgi:AdoMet-dependent heme synthase
MAKRHFYLQWDSIDSCNLRCKHCYHGDEDSHVQRKKAMSLSEVEAMIDDLDETSKRWSMKPRIAISGGEPLMRPDLYEILEYTQAKGMITNLLTNGTLLTSKIAKDINERGVNTLQISIDGTRDTHNEIRGRDYAFDDAIEGIRNASDARMEVVVSMTATRRNMSEFEDVVQIAYEAGAKKVAFQTYVPNPNLGTADPLYIGPSEIYGLLQKTERLTEKFRGQIQVLQSDVMWQVQEPENPLIQQAKQDGKFLWGCSTGFRTVSVLSDGTTYPCRRLPIPIGHISEGLAKLVIESEVMQNLRNLQKIRENTGCDKVVHCRGCRAVAYAVTGGYMAKDPMCYKELIELK